MGNIDPQSKYTQILRDNGIHNEISKIEIKDPNLCGEHFSSVCELVKVQFKDEVRKDINLFVKKTMAIPDPVQLEFFEKQALKEGFFFTKFVPEMAALYAEKTGKSGTEITGLFPKPYHADVAAIVMDDITTQGYEMLNKNDKQDLEHAKLALTQLARFQALSHAIIVENGGIDSFKQKYPHLLEDFADHPELMEQMSVMMSPPYEILLQLLKNSTVEGSSEIRAKLSKYSGRWMTALMDLILESNAPILPVVGHGDFWNNNMMFSGSSSTENLKVVFYDLGTCRVGSPNLDISYYIFTSIKPELRKQWKQLLRIYFDTFQETLEQIDAPFSATFEEFVSEYQSLAKWGLLLGMFHSIGMEAMKTMDTKDGFFMNNLQASVEKWVIDNKEKVDGIVLQVINLVRDYEEFGTL